MVSIPGMPVSCSRNRGSLFPGMPVSKVPDTGVTETGILNAETEQDKPCFVKVSDQVPVTSSGIALRIRRRNTVIEVSNDASDRILSLLKDAIMPC